MTTDPKRHLQMKMNDEAANLLPKSAIGTIMKR